MIYTKNFFYLKSRRGREVYKFRFVNTKISP